MATIVIRKDKRGEFRFAVKARNGEIVATSEGYKQKAKAIATAKSMKMAGAKIVDLTLEPAKAAKSAKTAKAARTAKPSKAATAKTAAKKTAAKKARPGGAKAAGPRPATRTAARMPAAPRSSRPITPTDERRDAQIDEIDTMPALESSNLIRRDPAGDVDGDDF